MSKALLESVNTRLVEALTSTDTVLRIHLQNIADDVQNSMHHDAPNPDQFLWNDNWKKHAQAHPTSQISNCTLPFHKALKQRILSTSHPFSNNTFAALDEVGHCFGLPLVEDCLLFAFEQDRTDLVNILLNKVSLNDVPFPLLIDKATKNTAPLLWDNMAQHGFVTTSQTGEAHSLSMTGASIRTQPMVKQYETVANKMLFENAKIWAFVLSFPQSRKLFLKTLQNITQHNSKASTNITREHKLLERLCDLFGRAEHSKHGEILLKQHRFPSAKTLLGMTNTEVADMLAHRLFKTHQQASAL